MLISTEDQDELVALEACEFWLAVAEQPSMRADVEPFLPDIVPRLLKSMVYTDEDIAMLGGDEDDYNVVDKASDINPQLEHSTSKSHKVNGMAERPATPHHPDAEAADDEDGESYDGYSDEDDDDEGYSDWNLRKCSAAALDVLSNVYKAHLFEVIKPFLVQNIRSENWKIREASVLALGAIAEGCMDGVVPHLPELYPYLLSLLQDQKVHPRQPALMQFLVRQISCWTLGRYGRWAAYLSTEEEKMQFFHPLMEGLLRTVYDTNKKVQEAGCSAFATLEEQAGLLLIPYLKPILEHLAVGFERFQHKNLLILYDAILTLADAVGQALNEPTYINLLIPPLLKKWQESGEEDRGLVALLEVPLGLNLLI
jgi:transportin-1